MNAAVSVNPESLKNAVAAALGFAAYVWVVGAALLPLLRMTRAGDSERYIFARGVAAAMLAYCTASMALSEAFASPLFLLVGLALAAAAAQTRPITADRRDPSSEPRACAG